MTKIPINIVWLQRDIRSQDHLPLKMAEESGLPYLIVFMFEPTILSHPDTSIRHLQFQYHSIKQLNNKLKPFHKEVIVFRAEALEVFAFIQSNYLIANIFSYRESGIRLTYDRDLQVADFCLKNNIKWQEFQRTRFHS